VVVDPVRGEARPGEGSCPPRFYRVRRFPMRHESRLVYFFLMEFVAVAVAVAGIVHSPRVRAINFCDRCSSLLEK